MLKKNQLMPLSVRKIIQCTEKENYSLQSGREKKKKVIVPETEISMHINENYKIYQQREILVNFLMH